APAGASLNPSSRRPITWTQSCCCRAGDRPRMNDYASAKQAYTASSVMTAPPQQLVVMLYDGAIRFLRQAATGMRAGNREVTLNRMQRAEAIVDELNVSLDMSQGEIAGQLRAIYLFSK